LDGQNTDETVQNTGMNIQNTPMNVQNTRMNVQNTDETVQKTLGIILNAVKRINFDQERVLFFHEKNQYS
jgi:hypothetical protein